MSASKTKQRPRRLRLSARVLANRRNALRSTGPKTPEGKARSAMNALSHGFNSSRFPLDGRDVEHLARHLAGPTADEALMSLARVAAAADLRLRSVRALRRAVWLRMHEEPSDIGFDPSVLQDPLLEHLLDPETRPYLLDGNPWTRADDRMVERIKAFAIKLASTKEPLRELEKLERYERLARSERDRALDALASMTIFLQNEANDN